MVSQERLDKSSEPEFKFIAVLGICIETLNIKETTVQIYVQPQCNI